MESPKKRQKWSSSKSTEPDSTSYNARDAALKVVEPDAIPNLIGSLHTAAYRLKDESGADGHFFVFPDLSVRTEGTYRIRLRFLSIGS